MKQKTEAQRGHTADQDCNLAHLTANDSFIAVPQVRKGTGREKQETHHRQAPGAIVPRTRSRDNCYNPFLSV